MGDRIREHINEANMTTEIALPSELLELAEQQPTELKEFRAWCQQCYDRLEEHELADVGNIAPNDLHEHAALLVRQALVYVRRFVDPQKADNMPRVGAKCVSHALIRFQECIKWCDSVGLKQLEDQELSPVVEQAYRVWEAARDVVERTGARPTYKNIYAYLQDELTAEDGYELPNLETWSRYVREGRSHYGTSGNSPRAGRTGRSIVGIDEL